MSAFAGLSSLELQRIWTSVHGRVVHGERITLGVIELDARTATSPSTSMRTSSSECA